MVRPNHAGAVKFWCGYLQALLHGYVKASLQESFVVSYNLAEDNDIEADYLFVHFRLDMPRRHPAD